jgi:hypothetical protein
VLPPIQCEIVDVAAQGDGLAPRRSVGGESKQLRRTPGGHEQTVRTPVQRQGKVPADRTDWPLGDRLARDFVKDDHHARARHIHVDPAVGHLEGFGVAG